jgi:thiol-disulfide isomerase/thioredoxin
MRRVQRLGFLLAVVVLGCATAPTITHRRSGATTTLAGLKGNVVVVNFWAEWCKPCIAEIPDIARVTDAFGPDVLFLPVYHRADSSSPKLAEWLDTTPTYFRDRVCFASASFLSQYDLSRIPHTYVYGRDGALVADYQAAISGRRLDQLRAAIAEALKR